MDSNPLLEYKREGTEMFMLMCSLRDEAVLTQLLAFTPDMMMPSMNASRQATERILDVASQAPQNDPNADIPDLPIDIPLPRPAVSTPPALPTKGAEARLFAVRNGVDKNSPCPCGSGAQVQEVLPQGRCIRLNLRWQKRKPQKEKSRRRCAQG